MNYESCIKGLTPEKLMIASSYLKGLVDGCGIAVMGDKEKKPDDTAAKSEKS